MLDFYFLTCKYPQKLFEIKPRRQESAAGENFRKKPLECHFCTILDLNLQLFWNQGGDNAPIGIFKGGGMPPLEFSRVGELISRWGIAPPKVGRCRTLA